MPIAPLLALLPSVLPTLFSPVPPAPAWSTLLMLLPVLYVAGATPFLIAFDVRHRRLPNAIVLPGLAV
ncbi:MAG: hypothetical protein JWR01_915, partial [Subtercola sp.]|nr:hypothetical protein [Subtercola sp.]